MLEIVLTPKILVPREIGGLGLSLSSLMVNPHLRILQPTWSGCKNKLN